MKQTTTEKALRKLLARIKSGEEPKEDCIKYRHVAGEISAYGALFAEVENRRKPRPSNARAMPPATESDHGK